MFEKGASAYEMSCWHLVTMCRDRWHDSTNYLTLSINKLRERLIFL
jgi:hypothetical protein